MSKTTEKQTFKSPSQRKESKKNPVNSNLTEDRFKAS